MSLLVPIEAFDNFKTVKDFPITGFATDVLPDLIQRVKELDEREEFEPWLERAPSLNSLKRVNLATVTLLARHLDKLSVGQFDYLRRRRPMLRLVRTIRRMF
jgi:hypothetical protein